MAASPRLDEFGLTTTTEVERVAGTRVDKRHLFVMGGGYLFWRYGDRWGVASDHAVSVVVDGQSRSTDGASPEAGHSAQTG